MDGITILSSEVVMTFCAGVKIIPYFLLGLLILGVLSFIIGAVVDNLGFNYAGAAMIVCSFILFLISIPIAATTKIPDYTKYEVILDDSVSMNEFLNRYEILDQRGQIYVVKEIDE